MKVLIIGDTHIDDPYLKELRGIFDEILSYDADHVIHLGDFYNQSKPTPQSLSFGTAFANEIIRKYKSFTLLAGNGRHNWLNSHSVIQYLSYLGVNCVGMELKREIDGLKCLFGHYMTNDSFRAFGTEEHNTKDFTDCDLVLLGHQHLCQQITSKVFHLGSVFYQTFGEVTDPHKRIAIIDNGKLQFIPLKSPVAMVDVSDPKALADIPQRTKVRLIIPDFFTFKNNVSKLPKWKEHFADFKYELRYEAKDYRSVDKGRNEGNRKISIIEEIKSHVSDSEVRELLIEQFKEDRNDSRQD